MRLRVLGADAIVAVAVMVRRGMLPWQSRDPGVAADITAEISRTSSALVVSGTAALPDGAKLSCQIWRGYWLESDPPAEEALNAEVELRDGRFRIEFGNAAGWLGIVSAAVGFTADNRQPHNVQDVVGSTGERLAFADIGGDSWRAAVVFVSARFGPPDFEPTIPKTEGSGT